MAGSIIPWRATAPAGSGATSGAIGRGGAGWRAASSTIGAAGLVNAARSCASSSQYASITARSRAISANGLSGRCLRARSFATASLEVASHRRWNPPRPFSATISPRAISVAIASTASSIVIESVVKARRSARARVTFGPHAWHAIGSAW